MAKQRDKAQSVPETVQDNLPTNEASEAVEEEAEATIITDDIEALRAQLVAERGARKQAEQEADLNRQKVEAMTSTKARPASVLDTETFMIKERDLQIEIAPRAEQRPVRVAPKGALGEDRYRVRSPQNYAVPILRVNWTIPASSAQKDRFDVYEVVFRNGIAHVPAEVGEWYRAFLSHKFEVVNI